MHYLPSPQTLPTALLPPFLYSKFLDRHWLTFLGPPCRHHYHVGVVSQSSASSPTRLPVIAVLLSQYKRTSDAHSSSPSFGFAEHVDF